MARKERSQLNLSGLVDTKASGIAKMSVLQFPENLKMTKRAGYDECDKTDSTETRPLLKAESLSSPSGSSELSMAVRNKLDPKLDDVDAILPVAGEQTLHILVAEHDPVTRAHLKSKLEKLGHDVQIVVNGKDCVSLYRTVLFDGNLHPFDIVLMGITVLTHLTRCFLWNYSLTCT